MRSTGLAGSAGLGASSATGACGSAAAAPLAAALAASGPCPWLRQRLRRGGRSGCGGFGRGPRGRLGCSGLGGLGSFTRHALLLLALAAGLGQFGFLLADRLGLRLRFFLAPLQVGSSALGPAGSRHGRRVVALDEDALLAHLDLDRARRPLASACLISVVDLRVSVIFLRSLGTAVPCAVRR